LVDAVSLQRQLDQRIDAEGGDVALIENDGIAQSDRPVEVGLGRRNGEELPGDPATGAVPLDQPVAGEAVRKGCVSHVRIVDRVAVQATAASPTGTSRIRNGG